MQMSVVPKSMFAAEIKTGDYRAVFLRPYLLGSPSEAIFIS